MQYCGCANLTSDYGRHCSRSFGYDDVNSFLGEVTLPWVGRLKVKRTGQPMAVMAKATASKEYFPCPENNCCDR